MSENETTEEMIKVPKSVMRRAVIAMCDAAQRLDYVGAVELFDIIITIYSRFEDTVCDQAITTFGIALTKKEGRV